MADHEKKLLEELFETLVWRKPGDAAAAFLAERSDRRLRYAAPDWDGVERHDTKR